MSNVINLSAYRERRENKTLESRMRQVLDNMSGWFGYKDPNPHWTHTCPKDGWHGRIPCGQICPTCSGGPEDAA